MPECHKCGYELKIEADFGRQDTCTGCGFSTRVCLNCINYDPRRYNECSEPIAERVIDKEKANFCDYFAPGEKKAAQNASDKARLAAEALFKKS